MPRPSLTDAIKRDLWRRHGRPEHPSEWDGRVYGGGRLSQRFWEYFKAAELLDLRPDSVVLDLGGGSPSTGLGFFMEAVAPHVAQVIIMDPQVGKARNDDPRVLLVPEYADRTSLERVLRAHPGITHLSSVSVLEHVEPEVRRGIFEAVDAAFRGETIVLTLEYHVRRRFFEQQLTARSLSDMVEPLNRFYLDAFEASPVACENAVEEVTTLVAKRRRLLSPHLRLASLWVPQWYPLALRFRSVEAGEAVQGRPG